MRQLCFAPYVLLLGLSCGPSGVHSFVPQQSHCRHAWTWNHHENDSKPHPSSASSRVPTTFLQSATSETSLDSAAESSSSSSSSCSYTRTFARHRIDLTSPRRIGQEKTTTVWNSFLSKVFPKQDPLARVRQYYPEADSVQLLSLLDCDDLAKPSSATTIPFAAAATMTTLWKAAADYECDCRIHESSFVVWILPSGVSTSVVQNWVEIYAWWLQIHDRSEQVLYELVDDSIPCVRIIHNSRPRQSITTTITTRPEELAADHDKETTTIAAIHQSTRHWVKRLLVEQQICPFTKSTKYSGQGLADLDIPVAKIDYRASLATTVPALLADTWTAMYQMLVAGPDKVSSILLAAPAWNHDFDTWAGPIFGILEASVVAARAEADLGVVCFHPNYQVSDGSVFCGFGHMHSVPRLEQWVQQQQQQQESVEEVSLLSSCDIAAGGAFQRRTPHATINVLRADQLQAAESKRSSSLLYPRNIQCLYDIGWDKLQRDLDAEQQMR